MMAGSEEFQLDVRNATILTGHFFRYTCLPALFNKYLSNQLQLYSLRRNIRASFQTDQTEKRTRVDLYKMK